MLPAAKFQPQIPNSQPFLCIIKILQFSLFRFQQRPARLVAKVTLVLCASTCCGFRSCLFCLVSSAVRAFNRSCGSTSSRSPLQQQWPLPLYLRLLPPSLALFDVALHVLVCSWPIYNNPPLAGLIPSRVVLRFLPSSLALFDVALHVLVCSWPIYNNPSLAGLIPSRVVSPRLSTLPLGFRKVFASACYCVVLVVHTCSGVFPLALVVVLSVMDVGCAFSAFSRCLLSCIIFFFFFVLQSVFRVKHPFLLRSSTVILGFKASGTVF